MRTRAMLLAVVAAAIAVAAATAAGGQRWADPREDSGTAPDITDVSVASDDTGRITIAVTLANRPALDEDDTLLLAVDADRQGTTGSAGIDYVLGVGAGSLLRASAWSDARGEWVAVQPVPFSYGWNAGTATFELDRAALGWTMGFDFAVAAWDNPGEEPWDVAPASDDRWSYSLRLPFALRVVPTPLDTLGKPNAGEEFLLGAHVVREDTGATLHAGRIACAASVAGRRLAQSSKPRFFRITVLGGSGDLSQALCSWKVPVAAKGKTLRAAVTVSLGGKSATRSSTAKVR